MKDQETILERNGTHQVVLRFAFQKKSVKKKKVLFLCVCRSLYQTNLAYTILYRIHSFIHFVQCNFVLYFLLDI